MTPSEQAKKLGLQYVGFGRYEDPKSGQVTYIVQNNRLVPFNKAVKTNSYIQQSGNDFGSLAKDLNPAMQETAQKLMQAYPPEKYDDDELDAIKLYTDTQAPAVSSVLSSLPTGIPANKIQPLTPDDNTPDIIAGLDSALSKSKTPDSMIVYAPLDQSIDLDKVKNLTFKSFRSTTINIESAIQEFDPTQGGGTVLQIEVPKGSKGMYVDDFSTTPGKGEFLLPRSQSIKILAGPNKLVGTYNSPDQVLQVYFYNCILS